MMKKHLDLAKAIRESDSKLLRRLPGFIINFLRKVVHEDDINNLLVKVDGLEGVDFHNAVLKEFNIKIDIEGLENIPENGKAFFFANHPYGVADGLILTKIVLDKFGTFKGIGNEAFKYVPALKPYIAVVNAYGTTSKEYIMALEEVFASDLPITHFPAGEVSRKYHGKIQDREWRKSLVSKAVAHNRDLVPFFFHGYNSKLFHGISNIRRMLGIKLNFELALLPHEFFNKRNKTIKVTIGKPISYEVFDKRFNHQEWTDKVREHLYSLEKEPNSTFKA